MSYEDLMQVLGALESKVETLTGTVQRLKVERDQLKQELSHTKRALQDSEGKLEASEKKLAEMNQQAGSEDSYKDEIRQRITSLIDKINQLEGE